MIKSTSLEKLYDAGEYRVNGVTDESSREGRAENKEMFERETSSKKP